MSKKIKIAVENFRVFKEMAEFELRPLTILIGPNNSGKSSFTKLLLLLKNGYNPLNFRKGAHHLGSYDRALNWDSESDEIILKNEAAYSFSPDRFTEEIRYNKNGRIQKQTITNNKTGQNLLKFEFLKEKYIQNQPIHSVYFSFDINYLIDLLYNKEILVNCSFIGKTSNFLNNPVPLKKLKKSPENEKISLMMITNSEEAEYYYENQYINNHMKHGGPLETDIIHNSILMNEINNLERDYLLCDVYVNGKKIKDKDKIRKYQNQTFYKRIIFESETLQTRMEDIFNSLKNELKHQFEKEYNDFAIEQDDKLDIEVRPTSLGRIIFTENLFEDRSRDLRNDDRRISLFQYFRSLIFTELNLLKNIEYIPANRGNQSRVLLSESNESTYKWISEYHKNKRRTSNQNSLTSKKDSDKLLKLILREIEIVGKITTKDLEDTASAVYIESDGKKINLADFGFGYSQLIPIILKIYNLSRNRQGNSILIIEEPEANLHPNLQAKLADIFALVIKHYPNWKVIVESHSEYLIRKLQYLIAKQEIERDGCIIYYFNTDENVNKEEPKVKPIEINGEGNLTENFGPGFFDEATRLQFELLKLNRNQSN